MALYKLDYHYSHYYYYYYSVGCNQSVW